MNDIAAVPRGHEAAAAIPEGHGGATIPRGREATAIIPQACRGATVVPRGCEAIAAIPQVRGGAATAMVHQEVVAMPRGPGHETSAICVDDAAVPRVHKATTAAPRAHEVAAAIPFACSATCEDVPAHRGRYSKNPKRTIEPKLSQIGFYPPLWTQLLETAKAQVCRMLFLTYPFPCAETAKSRQCSETLFEIVAFYEQEGKEIEASMPSTSTAFISLTRSCPGYFPEYKDGMAQLVSQSPLLCSELTTF